MTRVGTDQGTDGRSPRDLPESLLSDPVSAWLRGQGFTVWAEVPCHGTSIDLVGLRPADQCLVAVELKTALTRHALRQAMLNQVAVHRSYAAVAVRPRSRTNLQACVRWGVGLLWVESQVQVLIEPGGDLSFGPERRDLLEQLGRLEPGGVAGLPCLPGCGPAQECERAIAAYRREHPAARWAEIWRAVPNHYTSPRSLQGAMRMLAQRRAFNRHG